MATTDPIEWRLLDTDLETTLAILPSDGGNYSAELNEPATGELKIPLESNAYDLVSEGMFIELRYRGASRGGFFVDNINPVDANQQEGGGQWVSLSGRGALALLDDALVWNDGTGNTKRNFTGTKAGILIDLIDAAKTRGCFPNLTYDFTDTDDSLSNAWTDDEDLSLPVDLSILEVLRQFSETGIDFDINLSGGDFVLSAYRDGKGDTLSSTYFRIGTNCEEVSEKNIGLGIKNALQIKYRDAYVSVTDSTSITNYRRREGKVSIEAAQTAASALTYGAARLANEKNPQKSIDVKVFDGVKPYVYEDYDVGDYIVLDRFGVEESRRVRGFRLLFDEGGTAHVSVNLNSILLENEIKSGRNLGWLLDRWNTAHDADLLEVRQWARWGKSDDDVTRVNCVIRDGNTIYVGGLFSRIGGIACNNFASYDLNSGTWNAWDVGVSFEMYTICIVGGEIYISGNSAAVYHWTGTTWEVVGNADFLTSINALATDGTDLYATGTFNDMEGALNCDFIAKYDISADDWLPLGAGLPGFGLSLLWDDDNSRLVVGIDGYGVRTWNGSSWTDITSDLGAGNVYTFAILDGDIVAGGDFLGGLKKYTGTNWVLIAGGTAGDVYALAVNLSDLYVGGDFTDFGNYIGRVTADEVVYLAEGVNNDVLCICVDDAGNVYAAGEFSSAGTITDVEQAAIYFVDFQSIIDFAMNQSGIYDLGAGIHGATATTSMSASDEIPLWQSLTERLRKITWANLLLSIKTWADGVYVALTGNQTIAGVKTFSSGPIIPDEAYDATNWNGSLEPPTKNAVRDKIESMGGGGGTPGGSDTQVQYNSSGSFAGDAEFVWDATNKVLTIGDSSLIPTAGAQNYYVVGDGESPGFVGVSYGAFATFLTGFAADGTGASKTNVKNDMVLVRVRGRGWDGSAWTLTKAEMRLVADGDWASGDNPTRIELWTTPDGSGTLTLALTIGNDGKITFSQYGSGGFTGTSTNLLGVTSGGEVIEVDPGSGDGWTAYSAVVPTRTVADDPTYTLQFASVDLTGVLCEGMPIKWTQNGIVRYGWISSAPAFSTNTTITVLTICNNSSGDYDVLDTGTYTISNFSYGLPKQPGFGFPVDPSKWTIEVTDSTGRTQASPTQNTWYNLGTTNCQIIGPIGRWLAEYMVSPYAVKANTNVLTAWATLSTANNSESDTLMTAYVYIQGVATSGGANMVVSAPIHRSKQLSLASKTTLYLNGKTSVTSVTTLGFDNSASPMVLRLTSSYL